MAVEVVFEALPGGASIGVEEMLGFGGGSKGGAEGGPVVYRMSGGHGWFNRCLLSGAFILLNWGGSGVASAVFDCR